MATDTDKVILHPSGCTSTDLYPKTTVDQVFFSDSANLSSIIPSTTGTFAISNTSGTIGTTVIANMPIDLGAGSNSSYILQDTVTDSDSPTHVYSYVSLGALPSKPDSNSKYYVLAVDNTGNYSWVELTAGILPTAEE